MGNVLRNSSTAELLLDKLGKSIFSGQAWSLQSGEKDSCETSRFYR